jgi:hypothetical protein
MIQIIMSTIYLFNYVFNNKSRINHIIMSFMNGKKLNRWMSLYDANIACKMNYIFILEYLEEKYSIKPTIHGLNLIISTGNIIQLIYFKKKYSNLNFTHTSANLACRIGNLDILELLFRKYNIKPTIYGADIAMINKYIHIINYLYITHEIKCTTFAYDTLYANGNRDFLIEHDYIQYVTQFGYRLAINNNIIY